jgi:hypothetical protein
VALGVEVDDEIVIGNDLVHEVRIADVDSREGVTHALVEFSDGGRNPVTSHRIETGRNPRRLSIFLAEQSLGPSPEYVR